MTIERQVGKFYVYSYSSGLLLREATADETSKAEALNKNRRNKLFVSNDEGVIDEYTGAPIAPYSQGVAD